MSQKNKNISQSLDKVISEGFSRYSKYIIQERALPDARDGLKPVQRRILFSMSELGLFYNKNFKKSARVVGEVIGKYHPHGDSSIYEAMVRMSQWWKMNATLINMHGNNGSIDDDPAAAMRYTEVKLTEIAQKMLDNIKKNAVPFSPNFDDTEKEPTVLPALIPNLLLNGAKGIAAGYATEMPPHNLGEIIDAIIWKIKFPNARLESILKIIKGPDFPTGGIVQGTEGIYQALERGSGRIIIKSKTKIIEGRKPKIIITEIPYGVVKAKLVREIDEIRFKNSGIGISEVRDQSDRNGLEIAIKLEENVNPEETCKFLFLKTQMQIFYNYNNVAIHNNTPKQMGILELIDCYIAHQKIVQKNILNYDLKVFEKKLEIVNAMIVVSKNVDKIISVIKKATGNKKEVIEKLKENFSFSDVQAKAVAEMQLYRLSKTEYNLILEDKQLLESKIKEINSILNSEKNFNAFLISNLRKIKKNFARPRKTIVEEKSIERINVNFEDIVKKETVWVSVSELGYLKRFSDKAYNQNPIEKFKLDAKDSLVFLRRLNTTDKLVLFTNLGNFIVLPVHDISEAKFTAIGNHINTLSLLKQNEKIVEVMRINVFDPNAYVILVTKGGKIKKTKLEEFETKMFKKSTSCFKLMKNDELIGARISNGNNQIILISSDGRAVKYHEITITIRSLKASGMNGMSINLENAFVSSFVVANKEDLIILLSNKGAVKKIININILPSARTTKGQKLYKTNNQYCIDARTSIGKDQIFLSNNQTAIITSLEKIGITNSKSGFSNSLISNPDKGRILIFDEVLKISEQKVNDKLKDEQIFEHAEEEINKISQMSIDNILKNIK